MKLFAIITITVLLSVSLEAHIGIIPRQPDIRPISPSDAVAMASGDIQTVPAELRDSIRYLSLHNITAADRAEYCQCLDFILNSLSRRRTISYCQPVNGSNGSVVRVLLDNYGITHDGWENLASKGSGPLRISRKTDQPEPYFQVKVGSKKTVTKQRQRTNAQGQLLYHDVGMANERPAMEDYTEEVVERTAGAWIDLAAMTALQTATHSSYPILRADWFVANATMAPAYYELLGIKTLKDFHNLVRFREQDNDLASKGIVTDSQEVSLNNRAILMTPTSLGRYFQTFDYLTSSGENNLLRDLVKKRRDAGEAFAEMPNGLQAYVIVDGKDNVIDVADANIVVDRNTPWRHKLLFGGMYSCVTCHQAGAKDVNEEVRKLAAPPIGLIIPLSEKKKAEEVKDLFFSGTIDDPIAITKAVYKQKVAIATRGLTPEKNSALLQKLFLDHMQKPLTLAEAAAEVGCTPAEFVAVMPKLKAPAPEVGNTMLPAGRPLRREIWEDGAYQQAATIFYQLRRAKP